MHAGAAQRTAGNCSKRIFFKRCCLLPQGSLLFFAPQTEHKKRCKRITSPFGAAILHYCVFFGLLSLQILVHHCYRPTQLYSKPVHDFSRDSLAQSGSFDPGAVGSASDSSSEGYVFERPLHTRKSLTCGSIIFFDDRSSLS